MKTKDSHHPLVQFLQDERCDKLLGRPAVIRLEIYAARFTSRPLCEIATKHGLSKAAMTRHARRVRELYG